MGQRLSKGSTPSDDLRREAEQLVAGHPHDPPPRDSAALVHELEIHQVELEMQNEELQRAHVELAEARDRYQELYDLAPIAYVTLDRTSRILEANLAAGQLLHCDRARLVGMRLSTFLAATAVDEFHHFREAVFASGTRRTCELAVVVDGRMIPVHVDALAVASPAPSACRCVLVDLSELRAAQEQARSQAARIQTMFDTAPSAIIGVDDAGQIETVSAGAERLFGYRADELRGQHIHRMVPSLHQIERCDAHRVIGRRKDGIELALLLSVGEWEERGHCKRTVILLDQTKQDAAERRQRESEERFRQIAETIDDVFYIRERNGWISYASPAYERLRGEPVAELYKRPGLGCDAVYPEDRERMVGNVQRALAGGSYDEEFRLQRADGAVRWVRDRAFPVCDPHGGVERVVGVIHDVTIERELELALRQAQKMEAVGALASGVAHDFNNVLQVVFGVAELASAGELPTDRLQTQMRRIRSAAQRGADLVHRLMAFARKEHIVPKPIELDLAISDSVKLVKRLVTEQISVVLDLRTPGRHVLGDAVQIEQILLNLATNARDAMPQGGTLRIETREVLPSADEVRRRDLRVADRYLCLVVRDNGIGMDEATRVRVFEPFFTTKEVGKGTGLGLATVYTVASELGGAIDVESSPGRGTTFAIMIPCCESPPQAVREREPIPMRLEGVVLLVDDDQAVRATVRGFLEAVGLEVVEAATPEEALQLYGVVDLIVTDVVMPRMTGPRLVDELRRTYPAVRALFVSAHPLDYLVETMSIDRNEAFLQKPFSKGQLTTKVAEMLA